MAQMFSGLFGGGNKTKAPKPTPTPVMPVADDASVQAAKLAEEKRRQAAQGRLSTILSDSQSQSGGVDTLGG